MEIDGVARIYEALIVTTTSARDNRAYLVQVYRDGESVYEQFEAEFEEGRRTAQAYLDWQREQDS